MAKAEIISDFYAYDITFNTGEHARVHAVNLQKARDRVEYPFKKLKALGVKVPEIIRIEQVTTKPFRITTHVD